MTKERLKAWGAGIGVIAISLLGYDAVASHPSCPGKIAFDKTHQIGICPQETEFTVYSNNGEKHITGSFSYIENAIVYFHTHDGVLEFFWFYNPHTGFMTKYLTMIDYWHAE
jgi:hypothetical protein